MKIIVNADDYGFDEKRTMDICDSFQRGLLSTTSIMTNRPWFEYAVGLARRYGFFDKIGFHFNITEGEPLTDEMRSCDFFCEEGLFTGAFHRSTRWRLHLGKKLSEVVRREAEAQIAQYMKAGFTLMHFDSHHHVHTDYSIARVLFPMAKKAGFRTCRMSRTIGEKMSLTKRLYKRAFNWYARRYFSFMVDDFTDFYDFIRTRESLAEQSSIEVMVHPNLENFITIAEMESFWRKYGRKGFEVSQI